MRTSVLDVIVSSGYDRPVKRVVLKSVDFLFYIYIQVQRLCVTATMYCVTAIASMRVSRVVKELHVSSDSCHTDRIIMLTMDALKTTRSY